MFWSSINSFTLAWGSLDNQGAFCLHPVSSNYISMSAPRSIRLGFAAALGALLSVGFGSEASAQSVMTVPVGAVTLTASAAPSLSTPRYTSLALPLLSEPAHKGRLSAITSNSITVDQSVAEVITASDPYFIRVTSGANQGLTLLIKSNSGSTLSVDTSRSGSLTSLPNSLAVGSSGDTFTIYPADTLISLFGSAVQGGANPSSADQVWLWQPAAGAYAKFYYNTVNNRWQDTDFDDPANNVILLPDMGVMYMRRATSPVSFVVTGTVPEHNARPQIRNSGYTFLATGFPVPVSLASLGLEGNANWVKASSLAAADQVWIWQPASGSYAKYFYNSNTARWEDGDFGDPAGTVVINPQTPAMIKRVVTGQVSYSSYTLVKPYTL
jgi:uncharacterized protein (TIGR02597 family)